MASSNGLVCFTGGSLVLEDGSIVKRDLWLDEIRGVFVDAQKTFFLRQERPDRTIDLEGNILCPGYLDIQINGAYGFDFSVYNGDDEEYRNGLAHVAEKIVETGVTSLVPTIITQEKSLYPKLLELLKPYSKANSATMLGWHAEGPFIEFAKRGAHAPSFLLKAEEGFKTFEAIYGSDNLADAEDWLLGANGPDVGVRIITAAPEIRGVMSAIKDLTANGIVFSIGHSIATSDLATQAVRNGARLITHLFNAMPQLHHRDPSIIGLLGASPHLYSSFSPLASSLTQGHQISPVSPTESLKRASNAKPVGSEALDDVPTPPLTPAMTASHVRGLGSGSMAPLSLPGSASQSDLRTPSGATAGSTFERPYYELIVDGIHSHPNSVRLAYSADPTKCVLITDAMKILDPNLQDGIHEWRDGKRFVKEGDKLFLEGTDTLAGSVITLDKCVRNFVKFTGCSLGEAIVCATYNPAKCLGIENKKGTLRPGADADFLILNQQGFVQSTWVKGKLVASSLRTEWGTGSNK